LIRIRVKRGLFEDKIKPFLEEIHAQVTGTQVKEMVSEEEEETPPFFDETKAKADELISDMISYLDPYDFQDLVAAVLEAMGYRAKSSPPGRDRGGRHRCLSRSLRV
jgi:restriction system protein